MTVEDIQFITTRWHQHNRELRQVRNTVFIEEQHVPEEMEWDDYDNQSIHFLALHSNNAVATARLKPDGQIGRIAVMKDYRHQGIASKLLAKVISHAKNNDYNIVYLHAQKQTVGFYKKFDFAINGKEFIDAGIPHQAMFKILI